MGSDHSFFAKFIGLKRWNELFVALKEGFSYPLPATKSLVVVLLALLLCSVGPMVAALEVRYKAGSTLYSTLAFGISAVFAILFQRTIKRKETALSTKEAFSLTHTAFALGCIPALLVVALDPSLLAKREQLLNVAANGTGVQVSKLTYSLLIALFTLWVAVTEEYLFRGLLISVVRRCRTFRTPQLRTAVACLLSSVLFGVSHYPLWGAGAALALTGIGLGLALGYVANGERIWPMILYHWGFDFLSTLIAIFS